jgi:hypothetical protein
MLVAPFMLPIWSDTPGGASVAYGVMLTNLETKELKFRLRFECTLASAGSVTKSVLDGCVKLVLGIYSTDAAWTMSPGHGAIRRDVSVKPNHTILVSLRGGALTGAPAQALAQMFATGLQGTADLSMPMIGNAAQLDRPARVLATAFVDPPGLHGVRSFLPPIGGSPEFLIPPDRPRGGIAGPLAKRRARARRRR